MIEKDHFFSLFVSEMLSDHNESVPLQCIGDSVHRKGLLSDTDINSMIDEFPIAIFFAPVLDFTLTSPLATRLSGCELPSCWLC